jgi:hypothetical protein
MCILAPAPFFTVMRSFPVTAPLSHMEVLCASRGGGCDVSIRYTVERLVKGTLGVVQRDGWKGGSRSRYDCL